MIPVAVKVPCHFLCDTRILRLFLVAFSQSIGMHIQASSCMRTSWDHVALLARQSYLCGDAKDNWNSLVYMK